MRSKSDPYWQQKLIQVGGSLGSSALGCCGIGSVSSIAGTAVVARNTAAARKNPGAVLSTQIKKRYESTSHWSDERTFNSDLKHAVGCLLDSWGHASTWKGILDAAIPPEITCTGAKMVPRQTFRVCANAIEDAVMQVLPTRQEHAESLIAKAPGFSHVYRQYLLAGCVSDRVERTGGRGAYNKDWHVGTFLEYLKVFKRGLVWEGPMTLNTNHSSLVMAAMWVPPHVEREPGHLRFSSCGVFETVEQAEADQTVFAVGS